LLGRQFELALIGVRLPPLERLPRLRRGAHAHGRQQDTCCDRAAAHDTSGRVSHDRLSGHLERPPRRPRFTTCRTGGPPRGPVTTTIPSERTFTAAAASTYGSTRRAVRRTGSFANPGRAVAAAISRWRARRAGG